MKSSTRIHRVQSRNLSNRSVGFNSYAAQLFPLEGILSNLDHSTQDAITHTFLLRNRSSMCDFAHTHVRVPTAYKLSYIAHLSRGAFRSRFFELQIHPSSSQTATSCIKSWSQSRHRRDRDNHNLITCCLPGAHALDEDIITHPVTVPRCTAHAYHIWSERSNFYREGPIIIGLPYRV